MTYLCSISKERTLHLRNPEEHPSKVAIAFWINLIFAAMYTGTVVIYTLIGRLPAFAP